MIINLTKDFQLHEFDCKCGCEMPESVFTEVKKLANQLQIIRSFIQRPIILTNAYRCPTHNKDVGGVSDSQHLLGKAADIKVKELEPTEIYSVINTLIRYEYVTESGMGLYNTFLHYDIRGTYARWDNR